MSESHHERPPIEPDIDFFFDDQGVLYQLESLDILVQELRDHFVDYLDIFDDISVVNEEDFASTMDVIQEVLMKHFARTELAMFDTEVLACGDTIVLVAPLEETDDFAMVSLSGTTMLQGTVVGLTLMDIPDVSELARLRDSDDRADEIDPVCLNHFGLCLVIEDAKVIGEHDTEALPLDHVALLPLNYPQLSLKKIVGLSTSDRSA